MKQYFSFVYASIIVFFLIWCTTPPPATPSVTLPNQDTNDTIAETNSVLKIVTTFPPLYAHTANLIDDNDTLVNLVPPGTSIHTRQPRPSDIIAMEQADLIITNGLWLEEFLQPYLDTLASQWVIIVDTSMWVSTIEYEDSHDESEHNEHKDDHHADHDEEENGHIDTNEEEHHHAHEWADPHIWLDVTNAIQQVANISSALIQADQSQEDWYTAQTVEYTSRLSTLDMSIQSELEASEAQPFVVFHDAYQYFFQRYWLDSSQIGLVQEFHGDAPSQRAISDLIERIEENNVKLLYTEPQFNPTIVQRLTQETGIETKEIDPIGSELSPEWYTSMMRSLTQAFIQ